MSVCLLRWEQASAAGAGLLPAGAQCWGEAPCPCPGQGAAPETPRLGEHWVKGSVGATVAEGSRGAGAWERGDYGQSPLPWLPQGYARLLAPAGCGAEQGAAVRGCASAGAGVSCPKVAVRCESPVAVCSEHPVSIPQRRACQPLGGRCPCLGFAVPVARGKAPLPASPHEAFPSFCLPADVLWLALTFLQLVTQRWCQPLPQPGGATAPAPRAAAAAVALPQCGGIGSPGHPWPQRCCQPLPCCCLWPSESPFWVGFARFAAGLAVPPHRERGCQMQKQ